MTTRKALALLLIGGAALLLIGCNPSGVGIFYRLENETPTQTLSSNLPTNVTVASMALDSSVNAYYIGAGNIYEADTSGTSPGATLTWNSVNAPTTLDSTAFCNEFVISGQTIYAIYADNSTGPYLYQAQIVAGSLTNLTWSAVSGFGPNNSGGFDVQSIFLINGQLLVSVQYTSGTNNGEFALYPESNASTPLIDTQQSNVVAGAFDATNNEYWFVSGQTVFTQQVAAASDPPTSALAAASGEPSLGVGVVYRGVYWSSILDTLFISTSDGSVYGHKSGTTTYTNIAAWPSTISTKLGLNGFGELNLGTTDVLLVGSDSGYYVLDISNPSTSFDPATVATITLGQPGNTTFDTATVNYLSTALATAGVIGFFTDSTANRIFALTVGEGLWRNIPATSGREWQFG